MNSRAIWSTPLRYLSLLIMLLPCLACNRMEGAPKSPLKIGLIPWAGWAHAYVAKEKGFFANNGTSVELVLVNDYTTLQEQFKAGALDGAFSLLPDVILMNAEGVAAQIVYVSDSSMSGDVIIGKPAIPSLASLKGKIVSFEGVNSFSHIFVLKSLEDAGIKEEDMRLKNLSANNVIEALDNGLIDAGHTWSPFKEYALKKGYKVLWAAKDTPGVIIEALVFHTPIIRERSEEIAGVVAGFIKAGDMLLSGGKDRDEAIRIMAAAENLTETEIKIGLDAIHQADLKENIRLMLESDTPGSLIKNGEMISRFYVERGQLISIPDIKTIIFPQFIENLTIDSRQP